MPPISKLYGMYEGRDLYVIGTGPSLRVFPLESLRGELTIGLNQAWRHGDWTYNLTVHGELIQDQEAREPDKEITWIASAVKKPLCISMNNAKYFVFWSKQQKVVLDYHQKNETSFLFMLHGIQTAALHLGYLLGCRRIYLVGVDLGMLSGDHHGHRQHVKYRNRSSDDVFLDMRETTRYVRTWLRKRGVLVFNLSSLIGVRPEEDYSYLVNELGLEALPEPEDTSDCVWGHGYVGDKL